MRHFFPVLVLSVAATACGGREPRAVSATAGLPEYTPEEAAVFGDQLSASVFGLPTEIPIESDPRLGERFDKADAVIRVRVATVSEEELAGKMGFTLALAVEPNALKGGISENPLEIQLRTGSPSLSQVQTAGTQFVGHRFVLFVKRYSNHGEPELHWHGEGDTPAFARALARTNALDEMRRKSQTAR